MINNEITTSKSLEVAMEKAERAKRQIAEERKKLSNEKRRWETRQKIIAGGIIHKYLPESFLFEEHEMNEIIKVAFSLPEVQKVISDIKKRASLEISNRVESEGEDDESESNENR